MPNKGHVTANAVGSSPAEANVTTVSSVIERAADPQTSNAVTKAPRFGANKQRSKPYNRPAPFKGNFKQPKTSVLGGVPLKTYFQIFVSNNVSLYSKQIYKTFVAADNYIQHQLTELQCEYVITIAILNRMVQCGVKLGYSIPIGSETLRIASQYILLPELVCKYIEAIGEVDLHGVKIVPYVDDFNTMMSSELYRNPKTILEEAQRPVPANEWAVDRDWIIGFTNAMSRVLRLRLGIRQTIESTMGRVEMLVGYEASGDNIHPLAPLNCTTSEFELGASYKFRCYDQQREWPGPDNYIVPRIFHREEFDPTMFVSSTLTETLVMRSYQVTH